MRNNTILMDGILSSIDSINEITMESEIKVLSSLFDSYNKAATIMENYDGDELGAFSVFQEADESSVQSGDPESSEIKYEAKKSEDSLFMKIIMFIPNILKKIGMFIKQAWNGEIVPTFKKVCDKASKTPNKAKNIFDKIFGKDESWIKEHAKELGIGGAALGAVLSFIAFLNREKLSEFIKNWLKNIRAFFKKIPADLNKMGVIFELTVANKVKTNVSFKGLIEAFKAIPSFFKAVKDVRLVDNVAKKTNVNILGTLENCISEADKIGNTIIIESEPTEHNLDEMFNVLREFDLTVNPLEKESAAATASVTLNEEQVKTLKQLFPVKKDGKDPMGLTQKLGEVLKNIGAAITSTLSSIKGLFSKLTGIFTKKTEATNAIENDNGTTTDGADESTETVVDETEGDGNTDTTTTDTDTTDTDTDTTDSSTSTSDDNSSGSTSSGSSSDDKATKKKQANEEYKKAVSGKSKKEKRVIRRQLAQKYGLTEDEVIHESMMFDIDDDSSMISESAYNSWYYR